MDQLSVGGEPDGEAMPSSVLNMFSDVRMRLVETGTRNRLVHVNRSNTRGNVLNVVNERSDEIHKLLCAGKSLRFLALGKDKIEDSEDVNLADQSNDVIGEDR